MKIQIILSSEADDGLLILESLLALQGYFSLRENLQDYFILLYMYV